MSHKLKMFDVKRDGETSITQQLVTHISSLIDAGAFVWFGDGHQGLLPVRKLGGDWWELNELATLLIGSGTGRALRLGDPVRVRVERVDTARGRVDLVPGEL